MAENYLNADQVVTQLGISKATLHRWMNEGKLKYYKLGRKTLYKPEDVAALIVPVTVGESRAITSAFCRKLGTRWSAIAWVQVLTYAP